MCTTNVSTLVSMSGWVNGEVYVQVFIVKNAYRFSTQYSLSIKIQVFIKKKKLWKIWHFETNKRNITELLIWLASVNQCTIKYCFQIITFPNLGDNHSSCLKVDVKEDRMMIVFLKKEY